MEHSAPHHPAIFLLDELVAEQVGPVVSKSMVFDRLLDLRNLVDDEPLLVAAVDRTLREVPGATMAPGAWWQRELHVLRAAVGDALCPGQEPVAT